MIHWIDDNKTVFSRVYKLAVCLDPYAEAVRSDNGGRGISANIGTDVMDSLVAAARQYSGRMTWRRAQELAADMMEV